MEVIHVLIREDWPYFKGQKGRPGLKIEVFFVFQGLDPSSKIVYLAVNGPTPTSTRMFIH